MPKIFKSLNQKGVIHLIPLFLILIGIIAGVYLVQHPQIFKPKATSQNIEFLPGACLTSQDGFGVLKCPNVQIRFTSPIDTGQTTDAGFSLVKIAYADENQDVFTAHYWLGTGTDYICSKTHENSIVEQNWFVNLQFGTIIHFCPSDKSKCEPMEGGSVKCVASDGGGETSVAEKPLTLDQRTIKWFCRGNKIWRQYYGEGYDPNLANTWKIKEVADNDDCNVGNRICQQYRNDKSQDDAVCVEAGVKSSCDGNTNDNVAECLTKSGASAVVTPPTAVAPGVGVPAGGTGVTGGAKAGAPIPPGCGDNPVAPPNSQTQWKTSCTVACSRNEDCEVNEDQSASYFGDINTTRWCYGFENRKIGSSRCMQLRYIGRSSATPTPTPTPNPQGSSPTSTPTPTAGSLTKTTTRFRFAEDPTSLASAGWINYTLSNRTVDYIFKDTSPGTKSIFAEFEIVTKDAQGNVIKTDIVPSPPSISYIKLIKEETGQSGLAIPISVSCVSTASTITVGQSVIYIVTAIGGEGLYTYTLSEENIQTKSSRDNRVEFTKSYNSPGYKVASLAIVTNSGEHANTKCPQVNVIQEGSSADACRTDCNSDACKKTLTTTCTYKTYDFCVDDKGNSKASSSFCQNGAQKFRCYASSNSNCASNEPNVYGYSCSSCMNEDSGSSGE